MERYVIRPLEGSAIEVEVVRLSADGSERRLAVGTLEVDWPPHGDYCQDGTELTCGLRFVGKRVS